jgi:hypothetical protein
MSSPRSQGLRSKRARIAASGLALLALIAQLGSVAHLAVVNHVACAEHGEMVEVSPDVDALRSRTATDTATQGIRADHVKAHGHDHCLIAAFRRERARAGTTVSICIPVSQERTGQAALVPREPPPAIALLDLAPKNSPPTA